MKENTMFRTKQACFAVEGLCCRKLQLYVHVFANLRINKFVEGQSHPMEPQQTCYPYELLISDNSNLLF